MTAVVRRSVLPTRRALRALAGLLAASVLTTTWAAGEAPAAPAVAPNAAPAAPADAAANDPKRSGPSGAVAGLPADLGEGLRYVRIASLAGELEKAKAALAQLPLVLDLRRLETTPAATEKLAATLRAIAAKNQGAVFLLISADTPPALRSAIPVAPRLVTVGIEADGVSPRVGLAVDPAADRAAYDAIVAGRSLSELTAEQIDKQRFDEARLARAHANGISRENAATLDRIEDEPTETDNAGLPLPKAPKGKDPVEAKAGPPVRDTVLQRAVFLHRALLALNKLPAGA